MLSNHVYNLLTQLTEEHKSLWRIKEMYLKEADDCSECKDFWTRMEKDKEAHVNELKKLVQTHLK